MRIKLFHPRQLRATLQVSHWNYYGCYFSNQHFCSINSVYGGSHPCGPGCHPHANSNIELSLFDKTAAISPGLCVCVCLVGFTKGFGDSGEFTFLLLRTVHNLIWKLGVLFLKSPCC